MNNLSFEQLKQKGPIENNEILKVTALIYLQEALAKEAFEECQGLIARAKGFGATAADVRRVLNGYINSLYKEARKASRYVKRF